MKKCEVDDHTSSGSLTHPAGNPGNKPSARNDHTAQPGTGDNAQSLGLKPLALGRGYLLKERFNNIEDVRHALDLVHRGKTYSDTAVLDILHSRQPTLTELLTSREISILRLLATGLTNAAIAAELRISEDKVENATKSIYTKLGHHPEYNPRVYAAIRWLREMPRDKERPGTIE